MQQFKQLLYRYRYFAGIIVLAATISIIVFQLNRNQTYREEIGDTGVVKSGPVRETPYHQEYEKALKFLKENRVLEAAEIYATLIEKEPNVPDPYVGLAICRSLLKNYEGAIELYSKALTINPVSIRAIFGIGSMYERLNDNATAIRFYNKVLKMDKDDADTHAALAQVYSKIGEIGKAKHHLSRFKELAPNSVYISRLEKIVYSAN